VVYGVVAAILAVAGFVLPRYLADRSAPELGETVVVPAGAQGNTPTPSTTTGTPEPGAGAVSPAPIRTAGDDDDSDDGTDDPSEPGDANDPDDDD
jgi:hypothetical protein